MSRGDKMLKVDKLNVHYGVINAVKNVSFEVNEGEIVALIGANGAGKTSIMHALSGLLKVTSGDIVFMNKNITKIPAHKIIANGLAQVPEGRRILPSYQLLIILKWVHIFELIK